MVWPGGLGCHYTLVSRTLGSAYMDSPFGEISVSRPAERELCGQYGLSQPAALPRDR